MALTEVKVNVHELIHGMYVSRLDRPWLETPFFMQGFYVESDDDINELKQYCKYVYVDVLRGVEPRDHYQRISTPLPAADITAENLKKNGATVSYQESTTLHEELEPAKGRYDRLSRAVEDVMEQLREGKQLNVPALKKSIEPMIESILRNPDAFIWLSRLKSKDDYSYNHSLSASIWAVAFGRHLGLPKSDLQDLAMGALLFDIGKTKIPKKILNKPERLTPEEFELVKKHVLYSMEILKEAKGVNEQIISIVLSHHERYDGSGYPRGLKGHEIPVFGRIAAIVDCYDAITSPRPYGQLMSPNEAVQKLYEWRDLDFQAELVEQFIQAIGLYPAGTLVELSNGEVGIVIAQNRTRRLRPKIMLVLDAKKQHLQAFPVVDLMVETEDRQGNHLEIAKSLEPGAYGIQPDQFFL